jgi:hypothetical protein
VFLSNRPPAQEMRTVADVYQVMRAAADDSSQRTAPTPASTL